LSQPFIAEDISNAIEKYGDMVRRICFLGLRNNADAEDVFQEVFLQYFLNIDFFNNEQHQKAWLCRVAFNKCKDINKSYWRQKMISINNLEIPCESAEQSNLITAVLQLPAKYKEVIYLHYYEGWTIPEIAEITRQNTNTVYSYLKRAKEKLRKKAGEI
jgi:RNA polymerase sigma factor (sigma-70 family)